MHCPKCGQNYPNGSQRFCDVDNARLVSARDQANRSERIGVFSTILPQFQTGAISEDANEAKPEEPIPQHEKRMVDDRMAELFFETDDDIDNEMPGATFEAAADDLPEPVFGRRIDPYEIPAGYIQLDEGDYRLVNAPDFDFDNPDAFLGRTVKGRYYVTERVGENDACFNFLAEDRLLENRRVIVRILANDDLDEVTQGIFAEERISLSHLNYPNAVRMLDSGEFADGTIVIVSEYIDDLSVLDVLQIHGPLSVERAARIIKQAGEALSEVHHAGILHRDLRPEFLILTHDGTSEIVKISEFGVSAGEPNADNMLYKAPENFDGQIPTIASDIYALGVIAFQILTRHMPFVGQTERDVLNAQRTGLRSKATDLRHDISESVDGVFEKVLAAAPLDRYRTAKEFGDAYHAALTSVADQPSVVAPVPVPMPDVIDNVVADETPEAAAADPAPAPTMPAAVAGEQLAWTRRSPEPPSAPSSNWLKIVGVGFVVLLVVAAAVWYYLLNRPVEQVFQVPTDTEAANPGNAPVAPQVTPEQGARDIEVPPVARVIAQPPNTDFFQNSKQDLKGDLIRNFVGFSVYYPDDWNVARLQESTDGKTRGKFLDISSSTPDGKLKEQMLISYYLSHGTFKEDAAKFPQLVKTTNETLKKLIPNYQMVSEGSTTVNGGWNAYEVRFQGSGTGENGESLLVWGRRLFIPAARPGVRAGYEITMLATSYADQVRSVDDVGTRGELASILYTFEPSQSF